MLHITLLVSTTLAASPVTMAAPGFNPVGLEQQAGDFYTDQVALQLAAQGLKVMTRSEVQAVVGHQRTKEVLGCGEDSDSCALELAGALGAETLLLGDVARLGDKYRLSVRVVLARNGNRLSSAVVTGRSEDAVLDAFALVAPRVAAEVTAKVHGETPPPEVSAVSSQTLGSKRFFWVPAVAGVAALGVGGFGYVQAKERYDRLRSGEALYAPEPATLRTEGQTWQTVMLAGTAVGAAALLTSAGLYLFGSETTVEAGVALQPGGASFGIAGAF